MLNHDVVFHREWHCVGCARTSLFVQPPCQEGHGADCPEWLCVECGAALLVGPYPDVVRARRRRDEWAA